jgi:acyl carrier protein
MENQEILKSVAKCLRSVRMINGEIDATSFVIEDLLFESIDIVDLLFTLEQEFKTVLNMIEFNQFVLDKVKARGAKSWDFTVQELYGFVQDQRLIGNPQEGL